EIQAETQRETLAGERAVLLLEGLAARVAQLEEEWESPRASHTAAEQTLALRRETAQAAARRLQEAIFTQRTLSQRIADSEETIRGLTEKGERLEADLSGL